jgi:2-C-methyl-D-erythritol 4-phosphate cytidylyltransferase
VSSRDVGAVLVAAGSASRYGKPKQFEELGGLPIYLYVARTFSLISSMHTIVIVGREENIHEMERGLRSIELPVKWRLVAGGNTRQDSVANGVRALHEEKDISIVLVHDVARALIDDVVILSVIGAAREHGSAIAGIEVVDTMKRVVNHEIVETVSRENLWRAQTPQGAKMELMLAAFEAARESNFQGTDESQLLERIGEQPRIVQGSHLNFKITYPIDLDRARYAVANMQAVRSLRV